MFRAGRLARQAAPMVAAAAGGLGGLSASSGRWTPGGRRGHAECQGQDYLGRFDGTSKQVENTSEEAKAAAGVAGKTAAKWSILSERVEGLVREMYMVVGSLDPYLRENSTGEGPAMRAIREKMDATEWGTLWDRRQTMFSYGAEMSTDPVEGQMVKMLTYMARPKSVLEVGMFTGYGAMAIAEALPEGGKVLSLDIDPFLKGWVQDVTKNFPEGKKHEIMVGPALKSLETMPHREFDMVFVDANKSEYLRYVEVLLERKMVKQGAMIIADNTLYVGYPYLSETYDTQPKRRAFGEAIKEFNAWVAGHPRLEQVILPVRDGVSLIYVKK